MKVNVDIMRESARTLNSTIEGQLKESKKILKEIIQNDLPQLNDKKKEEYKTELQSVKKQVNVIKENIKDISNWIMNKADQFESQEPKIMQIAENIEANVIAHSMNVKDATKIIKELNKNGKYFDKKYLKDVKAYICESDEEFERLYNAIGKKGDVSQVDSFVYERVQMNIQ